MKNIKFFLKKKKKKSGNIVVSIRKIFQKMNNIINFQALQVTY